MQHTHLSPFARPLYVMLKPAGALCNLRCTYCYYLDKKGLYPEVKHHVMSDATLETFIRQYMESHTTPEVLFTWHGGETLMRDIAFYRRALELQRKYANGRRVDNTLQTNGTLLTDDWCCFFRDNNFLIGISVDGTQACHDHYRRDHSGRPSFYRVMKGIALLRKHGVPFNGMGTVHDANVDYPLEFYRFFKSIECHYIQFSPIVERVNGSPAPWNVPPEKWGNFLTAIFDEWVRNDVGTYFVQYFDSTLANWVGESPGVCTLAATCGHAGVMEFNGDIYSCDHFVYPEHRLGNVNDSTLLEMMYSDKQRRFGSDKHATLPRQCVECTYRFACHGECPKNRISVTASGEPGLNYLCKGYYRFFDHVAPAMDFMKHELLNQRPPSNIMKHIRDSKSP
jgi:uncharacterized protein